jgi:type II secretory pathway pseudopilin PulG
MATYKDNRQGFALITVMLVVMIVALLATSAAVIGSANTVGNRYYDRQSQLEAVALEGVEITRAMINGNKSVYPDDGYATLENGSAVLDENGDAIPGVQRWTYVGPTGSTSGQYGVFGSIVSVARDAGGGVIVRRAQVFQESFAKFAYFTDVEPSNISFGGGDQIFGPVHTNDYLKIYSSGATFHDEAKTAKTVQGSSYGTFKKGYVEGAGAIAMPETAELTKLQSQAAAGNTSFTAGSPSGEGEAYVRIEFFALDLDGDGSVTGDDEGFFRVYRSTSDARWVSGDAPSSGIRNSESCGHYHADGTFIAAKDHPASGPDSYVASLSSSSKRCYLGGSDSIFGGFQATDTHGAWVQWPGATPAAVAGRPDAQYLFPLSRAYNPSFKGVIYVSGKVVVSGVLRGRVTLAATDEIIVGDDITYASDPGLGTCADILGLFSGGDVVVANNTLNAPQTPASGSNEFTYDDTKDEFVHAIVLALNNFTVEDYAAGSTKAEKCENANWGRGCLYLTGGIIQKTRGAVGTIWSNGGTGYVKRYSYDRCGATAPPPYFPTTGHFTRGQTYWVDPTGFSVGGYFAMLTS